MANLSGVENMQKKLVGSLTHKMTEFEDRLKAASNPTNLTLLQLQNEYYTFKELVSSVLKLMQQQIQECVESLDYINMHKRRKALVFNGIVESSNENIMQKVLPLLHEKMGLTNIDNSSIKQCYRLNAPLGNRPRPVIVYFCEHHIKNQVWNAKSKLKGSAISVSEFLTKTRQSILKNARNHFGMRNVWSYDGAIYIKLAEGRAKITSQLVLDDLIAKFPDINLSSVAAEPPSTSQVKQVANASPPVQLEKVQRLQPTSVASGNAMKTRRFATKK